MGYYNNHNLGAVSLVTAAAIGKKVTAYCKSKGILITPMKDPRFGMVNSYPEDAIALFVDKPFNSKELDNLQIDLTPSIVDSESLQESWLKVLNNLEPLTTRELLKNQCKLIEFNGVIARIGISSEKLMRLIQNKLAELQSAFNTTFKKHITITLEAPQK